MTLESEATRGVSDYGWHWPRHMVMRAWIMLRRYNVFMTPEELMSVPETWFADLEQMDSLYQFHVTDTLELERREKEKREIWADG